jgi:hypothetical protein
MTFFGAIGLLVAYGTSLTWIQSGFGPDVFGLLFVSGLAIAVSPIGAWMMYRSWNTPRRDYPPLGSGEEPSRPPIGSGVSFALPEAFTPTARLALFGFIFAVACAIASIPFWPPGTSEPSHGLWELLTTGRIGAGAVILLVFIGFLWVAAAYIAWMAVRTLTRARAGKLTLDDLGASFWNLEGKLRRVNWSGHFSFQITDMRSADPNWGYGIRVDHPDWGTIRLSTEAADAILREAKRHEVEVDVTINPKTRIVWYIVHR